MTTEGGRAQLVRRSGLIMPVNNPRFVEKAADRGADAIILDLEDSVPPAEKSNARRLVREAIPIAGRGGADILVRINKPRELAVEDIDASVWPGLAGLALPKVESAAEIDALEALVEAKERERGLPVGSVAFRVSIETAQGVLRDEEIARSSRRIETLGIGTEDFTLDLGIEPTHEGWELFYAKARLVIVARAAGIAPVGLLGSVAEFTDLAAFERSAVRARELGYVGASGIHPAQIPILNRVFSPTEAQVAHARRVVEAYEAGVARGTASVALDGKMVDIPVVDRARLVLARAEAIAAREARGTRPK